MAQSNAVTFEEWLQGLGHRVEGSDLDPLWLDDVLPPRLAEALSSWCQVPGDVVARLDVSHRYPLAREWAVDPQNPLPAGRLVLRPTTPLRFCPRCLREQRRRGQALHLQAAWALAWLTHCPRHHHWLFPDCLTCWATDALCFDSLSEGRVRCRRCLSPLEHVCGGWSTPRLRETLRLERALLHAAAGGRVSTQWVGPCGPRTFLRLVSELLALVARPPAGQTTLIVEHLPRLAWPYPRSHTRHAGPWTGRSLGERLSLLSGVVLLLRAPSQEHADALGAVFELLSSGDIVRLRQQARRWPHSLRVRVNELSRRFGVHAFVP